MDGECLSEQQAIALLGEDREALYEAAHEITLNFMGNKFDTCCPIGSLQDKGGALSTFAGGGMCPSCGL